MRKIKEVRLQNFQSHVDSTIVFDDYNIIHGSTNAGKSSIIRGIRWALYNATPAEGAEIRRFGTKETSVTVTFDDGRTIVRRRTNKDNEYLLIDENGNEQLFTQFGRGALKEVQDFHGMYQVNLFGEPQSINIVDQDEPPFFLSQGPTARGHLISRLAGTLLYESALVLMRRDSSALMKSVESHRNQLEDTQAAMKKLDFVKDLQEFIQDADSRLSAADDTKQAATSIRHQINLLHIQRTQYLSNAQAASVASEVSEAGERLQEAQARLNTSNAMRASVQNLQDVLANWAQANAQPFTCEDLESLTQRVRFVDNIAIEKSKLVRSAMQSLMRLQSQQKNALRTQVLCDDYHKDIGERLGVVTEKLQNIAGFYGQIRSIRDCLESVSRQEHAVAEADENVSRLSAQYSETLLELGLCPTCHQPIHQHEAEQAACVL